MLCAPAALRHACERIGGGEGDKRELCTGARACARTHTQGEHTHVVLMPFFCFHASVSHLWVHRAVSVSSL